MLLKMCCQTSTACRLSWLTQLVGSLSVQRPGFSHRLVHVGLLVDKLALRWASFQYIGCTLSVSFHQCSLLIHVSVTNAILY